MNEIEKAVIDGKATANEILLALLLAGSPFVDMSERRDLANAITTLPPPDGLSEEAQDHFRAAARDQMARVLAIAASMRKAPG